MTLLASSFTMSWTHSVERTEWVEYWRVHEDLLVLDEALVQGPGAGIELPENAVWENGGWRYRPNLKPLAQLHLAASGSTPSGWTLCTPDDCLSFGQAAEEDIRIWSAEICAE